MPRKSPGGGRPIEPGSRADRPWVRLPALAVLAFAVLAAGCRDEAGAADSAAASSSAPIAALRTDSWDLAIAYAEAVPLSGDRVLLVGGLGIDGRPARRAVVVDPAAGRVLPAGEMAFPRVGHTAVALRGPDLLPGTPDDEVLVVGGYDGRETLDTIEIWRPSPDGGTFTLLPDRLPCPVARHAAVAVALPDGVSGCLVLGGVTDLAGERVLLTGAFVVAKGPAGSPIVRTVAPPRFGRVDHTATLLPGVDGDLFTADDLVLIYGGYGGDPTDPTLHGDPFEVLGDPEIFDLLTETWIPVAANRFHGERPPLSWPAPRRGHAAVLEDDGSVLLVGGSSSSPGDPAAPEPLVARIERIVPDLLDPQASRISDAGDLLLPRLDPSVFRLADGRLVVSGGIGPDGAPAGTVECLVPLGPSIESFPVADLLVPRAFHAQAFRRLGGEVSLLQIGGLDGAGLVTGTVEPVDLPR